MIRRIIRFSAENRYLVIAAAIVALAFSWHAMKTMPLDALYQRCLTDLTDLGFSGIARDTLGYFGTFVEEGYPIYQQNYQTHRQDALHYLERITNLTSCGRQGSFRYVFMDTAMEMGLLAAERALEGRSATAEVAGLRSEAGLIETRSVIR